MLYCWFGYVMWVFLIVFGLDLVLVSSLVLGELLIIHSTRCASYMILSVYFCRVGKKQSPIKGENSYKGK